MKKIYTKNHRSKMKFIQPTKTTNCNDIVQCIYNLNKLDLETYKHLQKMQEAKATTLAQHMHKERSTVYRALQKLTNCGLCNKKTQTIKTGGYYHVYSCKNPNTVKIQLESKLDAWYSQMKKILHDFENKTKY